MRHDLIWTTFASLALILGNALLTYLLARRGAVEVFGPYNLAKRVGASAVPVLTLGMTLGLVNHIAATTEDRMRRSFATWGIAAVGAVLTALTGVLIVWPGQVAQAVLGAEDERLLWAIWTYTVALVSIELVFSLYRARFEQSRANRNRLISMTLLPLAVVLVAPRTMDGAQLVLLTSVPIIMWNGLLLAQEAIAGSPGARGAGRHTLGLLLGYSLPRMPAIGALAIMMAAGSFIATRAGELVVASHLLAAMSVVVLLNAALGAFSIVLLPRVAALQSEGNRDQIRKMGDKLLVASLAISFSVAPSLWVTAPELVTVWLGSEFEPATAAVRVVLTAVPATLLFAMLKSVADGAVKFPLNSVAATAGASVCVMVSLLVPASDAVLLAAAFVLGAWTAAVLQVTTLLRLLDLRLRLRAGVQMFVTGTVAGLGVAALGQTPIGGQPIVMLLGGMAGMAVAVVAAVAVSPADLGLRGLLPLGRRRSHGTP